MLNIWPQVVAMATGSSLAFTLSLGATYHIGIVTLQNLISDPAAMMTVSAGAWSSGLVTAWPIDVGGGVYDVLLYDALGRTRFFVPSAPVAASSINVSISDGGANLAIGRSADHHRAISWRNLHAGYTVIDPILLRSDQR